MMRTRKEERGVEISKRNLRQKAKRNLEDKILAMRRRLNDVYKERVKDANCGGGSVIARGKGLNLYMSNVLLLQCSQWSMFAERQGGRVGGAQG